MKLIELNIYLFVHRGVVENAEDNAAEEQSQQPTDSDDDDPGAWDENFKSHHDSKPNGPEAIALDFSFPQAQVLFGKLENELEA